MYIHVFASNLLYFIHLCASIAIRSHMYVNTYASLTLAHSLARTHTPKSNLIQSVCALIRINKSTYARIRYILIHWYIRMPKITINHCFCCIRIKCYVLLTLSEHVWLCVCVCIWKMVIFEVDVVASRSILPFCDVFIYFGKLCCFFYLVRSFVWFGLHSSIVRMVALFQVHSVFYPYYSQSVIVFRYTISWIVFIYVK